MQEGLFVLENYYIGFCFKALPMRKTILTPLSKIIRWLFSNAKPIDMKIKTK